MREAVIVDAVRTPLGRGKDTGALHSWHPVDLAANARGPRAPRPTGDSDDITPVPAEATGGLLGQRLERGHAIGRQLEAKGRKKM